MSKVVSAIMAILIFTASAQAEAFFQPPTGSATSEVTNPAASPEVAPADSNSPGASSPAPAEEPAATPSSAQTAAAQAQAAANEADRLARIAKAKAAKAKAEAEAAKAKAAAEVAKARAEAALAAEAKAKAEAPVPAAKEAPPAVDEASTSSIGGGVDWYVRTHHRPIRRKDPAASSPIGELRLRGTGETPLLSRGAVPVVQLTGQAWLWLRLPTTDAGAPRALVMETKVGIKLPALALPLHLEGGMLDSVAYAATGLAGHDPSVSSVNGAWWAGMSGLNLGFRATMGRGPWLLRVQIAPPIQQDQGGGFPRWVWSPDLRTWGYGALFALDLQDPGGKGVAPSRHRLAIAVDTRHREESGEVAAHLDGEAAIAYSVEMKQFIFGVRALGLTKSGERPAALVVGPLLGVTFGKEGRSAFYLEGDVRVTENPLWFSVVAESSFYLGKGFSLRLEGGVDGTREGPGLKGVAGMNWRF